MQYRLLGRTGVRVSTLGLGTMMFGDRLPEPDAVRVVHAALDAGVNLIDTADVYAGGESERILGRALKGRRHEAFLATKVRRALPGDGRVNAEGLSRLRILEAAEDSLRRLGTDHIDLYQVHWADPLTPLDETLRALDDLVRQGKVRYIGCSNFPAWRLMKSLWVSNTMGLSRFESNQINLNLLQHEAEEEILPACREEKVAVLAFSPLAGGLLTGKYNGGVAPAGSRGGDSDVWRSRLTPANLAFLREMAGVAEQSGFTMLELAMEWVLSVAEVSSLLAGPSSAVQWEAYMDAAGRLEADPPPAEVLSSLVRLRAERGAGLPRHGRYI